MRSGVPRSIGKFSKYAGEGASQRAKVAQIPAQAKEQEKNQKRRVQIANDDQSAPATPHSGTQVDASGGEIII